MHAGVAAPVARTTSGVVQGVHVGGVHAFLGIPYAAAPVESLFMRAPQPAASWSGIRPADRYGATAPKGAYPPQFAPLFPETAIAGAEYLNLNIWTPDCNRSDLPVLVWIHGGSFANGSGSVPEYNGSSFASNGVVCVTINYRLGAEGFLYLDDGPANLGLLDQLSALRWVKENIAAFGGDPARVTVAGQSAGAMSVTTLLAMPLSQGLFHQVIVQSGAAANTLTRDQGRLVGRQMATRLGVEPTWSEIAACGTDRLVEIGSALVTEVQATPDTQTWGEIARTMLPFAPVIDGSVLTRHPLEALRAGAGADVPMLIGTNRDEARLFLVAIERIASIHEDELRDVIMDYRLSAAATITYRSNRPYASPGDTLAAVITDGYYRLPAIRVAEAREGGGSGPTWLYRFDHPETEENAGLGACHGVEMPYVFNSIHLSGVRPRIGNVPSPRVAETTHQTWIDFIVRGQPGWPSYTRDRRLTGLIGEALTQEDDPAGDERSLWDAVQ